MPALPPARGALRAPGGQNRALIGGLFDSAPAVRERGHLNQSSVVIWLDIRRHLIQLLSLKSARPNTNLRFCHQNVACHTELDWCCVCPCFHQSGGFQPEHCCFSLTYSLLIEWSVCLCPALRVVGHEGRYLMSTVACLR